MFFKDIIGQKSLLTQLSRMVDENRLAHALLLTGPSGNGKLPIAVALARYILCSDRRNGDACGCCPSCVKMDKLVHSDLHFVFPVKKKKNSSSDSAPVSDDYIAEWREIFLKEPYFGYSDWLEMLDVENQQPIIYEKESSEILRKLSLKSREGGWKIMIIWLPEKMKEACSNKLLKILEEPPAETLFLLVAESTEHILPTILSRTQRVDIPRILADDIAEALQRRYALDGDTARSIAQQSGGDWEKAESMLRVDNDKRLYLELFMTLMRMAYRRDIMAMKKWSEQVAALGRERQKGMLEYCQRMIRENFIMNFGRNEMLYLSPEERNFSVNFSPFVNENNIFGIMEEISDAQKHVEQNVNAKMIFFDMALRMIVWIKNR
ncbi:MAG: DNA polymerase III subunit delta [Bacteroidaceae bacterium]|nr:DNA polymerase III subunit delta [Bacteroidaceae bacterium]MBQ5817892.1 DNA polymerase III subunit delta [Bacteroidaceae bacterium]